MNITRQSSQAMNFICKTCRREHSNATRQRRVAAWHKAEHDGLLNEAFRSCSTCKKSKALTEFSPGEKRCRSCCRIATRRKIRTTSRYAAARGIARKRQLAFELTREQFAALIANPCAYCDAPVSETGMGLDRIDSNLGYAVGNSVPCCGVCNTVKSDMFTFDEMRRLGAIIKQIREERTEQGREPLQSHAQIRARRMPDDT